MERSRSKAWLGAALLIAAGVAARLWFRDIPNFAPVAGLALFAGFLFRQTWLAASVPLGVMLISDQVLGGYALPVQLTVYACLTLPICLRGPLRRLADLPGPPALGRLGLAGGIAVSSLGCSLLFFLATNAAVWLAGDWYPFSWQGLVSCYVNALPFFRYTLTGDLLFSATLFSSWGMWMSLQRSALPLRNREVFTTKLSKASG
jgi:hypothetical protein